MIFFVTAFISCIANAQWTQCPLNGGFIFSLATSDSNVIAGTLGGGGVYLSENYGSNWDTINNGLPAGFDIFCVAERGNEFYASVDLHGMYKSTDNGANWSAINTGLPLGFDAWAIIFVDSNIFIARPSGTGGVYMSSDGGNTWNNATGNLSNTAVFTLVCDSTGIYAGTQWDGIFKTTDNGVSWITVNNGLPTTGFNFCDMVVKDSIIYAGIDKWSNPDPYRIFKSSDGGANWTLSSYAADRITKFAVCCDTIFMGTEDGVYKSSDGGNWASIDTGMTNKCVTSFAVNGLDIFAGTRGGVFFLAHDSTKWVSINNGICGFTFNSIEGTGNHLFAAERATGVYMSTDYGDTWTTKNNGLDDLQIPVLASNGNYIFAGNSYGLYRSQNYGDTWTFLNTGMPPYCFPSSLLAYGNNVLYGYYEGLFKSNDNGTTWTTANNGLPSLPWVRFLTSNSSNEVFAAISDVGVFMSSDNGAIWTNISNGAGGIGYVNSLATNDVFIIAGLDYWNPPVITTSDYGANWQIGSNGLFGQTINSLKTIGDCVFAATSNGVFFTKNNGVDWIDMSQGLPSASSVTCIGRDDSCIYAGVSGNGIWKRPISDFGIDFVEIDINDLPSDQKIFPNPASEILFIETNENATVEIINLQGQIVSTGTLTDKTNSINISNLSPGLYNLRIISKNDIVYRKIIKQ